MKKNKNEIARIETLLKSDRFNLSEGFSEVFLGDLFNLLSDYFDIKRPPETSMTKSSDGYVIDIKFTAGRIKYFSVVPK